MQYSINRTAKKISNENEEDFSSLEVKLKINKDTRMALGLQNQNIDKFISPSDREKEILRGQVSEGLVEIQRLNEIVSRVRSENVQLGKERNALLRETEEYDKDLIDSKIYQQKSFQALNFSYEKALR